MPAKSMTFPEQLKAYRESNGMSQAKLAEFLAVSPRAIWQWEQGQLPHILMQEGAIVRMVQKPQVELPPKLAKKLEKLPELVAATWAKEPPKPTEKTPLQKAIDIVVAKQEIEKEVQRAMDKAEITPITMGHPRITKESEAELLKRLQNPQFKKK